MAKIAINIKEGTIEKQEMIAGIDLGTTNSLIAFFNKETKQAETIKEDGANALVPSIVYFDPNGHAVVGSQARPFLITDPQHTIYSVKRLMGKSYKDVKEYEDYFGYKIIDEDADQLVKVRVGNKFYSPIELSALILKELKVRAEKVLQSGIRKAVITVPAYFNDSQRQATRDAGKLAGLEVLRIINEPTAASLAYGIGLDKQDKKTIAVYDLGGGTFDISLLKIHDGIFEVLSTHGDTFLGGDDFDRTIVDYWIQQNNLTKSDLLRNKPLSQALRLQAEKAKMFLSSNESYQESLDDLQCHITRSEFEQISKHLVDRTLDAVRLALSDSGLQRSDVDAVVMVGGATRIPLVKHSVAGFFDKPVNDSLNPDEVVALGAAIQADVLAGNQKDLLLLDVTPLSLGIETIGNLMDVIIPRNSKIPTSAARQYTTSVDGQTKLKIAVYQGERDVVADNRKLAEFILSGIPAMPAGFPKIEISFILNADGILKVKARELRSGMEQSIDIKPQYGLTDEEVEKMLSDSIKHAKDDMTFRSLVESKTEAQQVLLSAEKFLKKNAQLFSVSDTERMHQHIAALSASLAGDDKDLIQVKLDELNAFAQPFAHQVMDSVLGEAMKGKKV